MKYLITLLIAALSLNAFSQGIPQLPYNPDENGDGLIGVPDLQALLAQYSLEFNAAVLSEDEESAIVYMGEMAHPVCTQACDNLPGFWHMSTMADLGLVWDEVTVSSDMITWYKGPPHLNYFYRFQAYNGTSTTPNPNELRRCYCAANELPKVEYESYNANNFTVDGWNVKTNEMALDGWKILPQGTSQGIVASYITFWRWAE